MLQSVQKFEWIQLSNKYSSIFLLLPLYLFFSHCWFSKSSSPYNPQEELIYTLMHKHIAQKYSATNFSGIIYVCSSQNAFPTPQRSLWGRNCYGEFQCQVYSEVVVIQKRKGKNRRRRKRRETMWVTALCNINCFYHSIRDSILELTKPSQIIPWQ